MIYAVMSTYILCLVPKNIQPGTDSSTSYFILVYFTLSAGMYFLCHDLLYIHSSQRIVHADICIYLCTFIVYIRYIMARRSYS